MINVYFAEYCLPRCVFFCLYPVWSSFATSLVALWRLNFLKRTLQYATTSSRNLNVSVLHESPISGCCLKQVGDGQVSINQMPLVQGVDLFDGASMRAAYCVPDVKEGASLDKLWMAGWHIHGGFFFWEGGEIWWKMPNDFEIWSVDCLWTNICEKIVRLKRFWAALNSFDSMGMDRLIKIDLLSLSTLLLFVFQS